MTSRGEVVQNMMIGMISCDKVGARGSKSVKLLRDVIYEWPRISGAEDCSAGHENVGLIEALQRQTSREGEEAEKAEGEAAQSEEGRVAEGVRE